MPNRNYLLNTVENALAVLELVATSPSGLDLRRIASGLELPKATAYRLCYTLMQRGYIDRDPETNKYQLGVASLMLGVALQAQLRLGAEITPFLEEAVAQCGETVNVGVLHGLEVVLVNKAESPHALRMDGPIGGREPAHSTAMGKCLLAATPSDRLTALLGCGQPLRQLTPHTITDPDKLLTELEVAGARGYALDMEETYTGLICVAAPLVDHRGRVIAAVSISAPTARVAPGKLEERIELARRTASRISLRLGHNAEARIR